MSLRNSIIDYLLSEEKAMSIVEQYLPNYIERMDITDKSKSERNKWKLIVEGTRVDDLESPPREIPYIDEHYLRTRKSAEILAASKKDSADIIELWKLMRRW